MASRLTLGASQSPTLYGMAHASTGRGVVSGSGYLGSSQLVRAVRLGHPRREGLWLTHCGGGGGGPFGDSGIGSHRCALPPEERRGARVCALTTHYPTRTASTDRTSGCTRSAPQVAVDAQSRGDAHGVCR